MFLLCAYSMATQTYEAKPAHSVTCSSNFSLKQLFVYFFPYSTAHVQGYNHVSVLTKASGSKFV